ncbi:MAG: response regulator [Anaerolineales bacterium]|nr:response regulator [Anaerolineales bacterium]
MSKPLALIIEDEPNIVGFLTEALGMAGFTIEAAIDGQQALARLNRRTPDLVVLDLNLPLVSGEAVLRQIRSDPRLAGVPVVLTTGEAHIADKLRDEADFVLLKPFSFDQVHDLAVRLRPRAGQLPPHEASHG